MILYIMFRMIVISLGIGILHFIYRLYFPAPYQSHPTFYPLIYVGVIVGIAMIVIGLCPKNKL